MSGHLIALCCRTARTAAVAAAVFGASGAAAQSPADKYPEKPIKISGMRIINDPDENDSN